MEIAISVGVGLILMGVLLFFRSSKHEDYMTSLVLEAGGLISGVTGLVVLFVFY